MKDIKLLLGKRIKELRKAQKLSQEALAEIIDIDQRNLSNIECGISFPAKTLVQIADALKVSISDLFDFEHCNYDIKYMKKFIKNELDNLTNDDIKTIFRLVKSMR